MAAQRVACLNLPVSSALIDPSSCWVTGPTSMVVAGSVPGRLQDGSVVVVNRHLTKLVHFAGSGPVTVREVNSTHACLTARVGPSRDLDLVTGVAVEGACPQPERLKRSPGTEAPLAWADGPGPERGREIASAGRQISAQAAAEVIAPSTAAASGIPAPASSDYVFGAFIAQCGAQATTDCPLYVDGANQTSPSGGALAVLDFGAPCFDANGLYGTQLFTTTSCTTDDQLIPLAQAWLRGYQSTHGSSTPLAVLALGTSNSLTGATTVPGHALTSAQMQASAQAWFSNFVHPVAAALSGPAPVVVWGGDDAEQSNSGDWYGPAPSRAWVDAYGAAASGSLLSTRRCAGHDPFRLADYGDNVLTGGWSNDDIYHVAWGAPVACAVPEIYIPVMAREWGALNQWAQTAGQAPITFTGPMSEGGEGGTLSAADSWSQLASVSGQSPPYVTVIGALNATAPAAPGTPVAIASDGSATVYWSAPANDGGSPVTGYTVTASTGNITGNSKTVSGLPPVTSATISGLTNGTGYTFSVSATNAAGRGTASPSSNTVTPGLGAYYPLAPARILDTRTGSGPLAGGGAITVPIAGAGGIPANGVYAAVVNVTVTNTTAASYLTIYPAGTPQPLASSLNWTAGQTVPNLVEVAVGPTGGVNIFNSSGLTDVIVDVEGYVATPNATPGAIGLFNPAVPSRILDTRNQTGGSTTLGPNSTITLPVAGDGIVPASGAAAVVLNVTVTNPSAPSYLTVFPTGSRPLASNLNFIAGQTAPNRVIVPLASNGSISFYNASGSVDVVADIGGWFTDASNPNATGSRFAPVLPARILDTRSTQQLGPNQTLPVAIAGSGPIPSAGVAGVVLNVTVTGPTASSYLTVWPGGESRPLASDLNFTAGQTVPNMVVVKVGANGLIDLYNAAGSTDVVVDVMGWYG